jgi:hypothetical protein
VDADIRMVRSVIERGVLFLLTSATYSSSATPTTGWTMRRMLATIMAMLRRVSVDDDDLALAAAGCRALAFRYREDAKRQKNPMLVEASLARAEHAGSRRRARR